MGGANDTRHQRDHAQHPRGLLRVGARTRKNAKLAKFQERLAGNEIDLAHFFVVREGPTVVATLMLSPHPIPVVPTFGTDPTEETLRCVFQFVHKHRKDLLLFSQDHAEHVPSLEPGFVLSHHSIVFETDLQAVAFLPDTDFLRQTRAELEQNHVALLQTLEINSTRLEDHFAYEVLMQGGAAVAAVGVGTNGPHVGIDVLGVVPDLSGRGLGRRVYQHALALAKTLGATHTGGTDAGNAPMLRLMRRCCSRQTQEQFYVVPCA